MRVHCHNIQTCCIQSQETLWPAGVSAQVSGFCKWTKSLFDDTTALFDEYCINCDLAFVARLCLKIHNKSTRIRIVIHVISHLWQSMSQNTLWGASGKCSGPPVIYVISNYSSPNVISSYSSLNNFEEGRESKIRESKIFLYDMYDF